MESLIPIIKNEHNKKRKMPYELWIEDNKEDLILIYKLIKNYDKDMDFLNECDFSLFCSFCYQKSSGIKPKYS
jgi:hypothetical protein